MQQCGTCAYFVRHYHRFSHPLRRGKYIYSALYCGHCRYAPDLDIQDNRTACERYAPAQQQKSEP